MQCLRLPTYHAQRERRFMLSKCDEGTKVHEKSTTSSQTTPETSKLPFTIPPHGTQPKTRQFRQIARRVYHFLVRPLCVINRIHLHNQANVGASVPNHPNTIHHFNHQLATPVPRCRHLTFVDGVIANEFFALPLLNQVSVLQVHIRVRDIR